MVNSTSEYNGPNAFLDQLLSFSTNTILLLLLIPLIGLFLVLILPSGKNGNISKLIGLYTTLLNIIVTINLLIKFNANNGNFQFLTNINFLWPINFGIDGISLFFIVLTAILMPICLIISDTKIIIQNKLFILSYLFMLFLLNSVFTILDILGFYISFEAIIIPMFLVIGVWGSREEKVRAGYYFFLYTAAGSVLLLLSILYISYSHGTTDYLLLLKQTIEEKWQYFIFIAFFISFAAKIPLVPFHIWLPLAHVEAPVAGSVILAGLLIKLGAYGFIRFALPLTPIAAHYFAPFIITLAIISIIYASLTTIRQTDLKRIIAYSSVAHMGVATLAIFTFSTLGIQASIFLQIAHGVVSSALFILVTILYEHHHSRLVKYYRGITLTMPLFSMVFLIFTLANIGVPLSANFIGEFLSLLAAFGINSTAAIMASSGMVLSACYALFLMGRVCFGQFSPYLKQTRDLNEFELIVAIILIFFTLLLGLFPNLLLSLINPSTVILLTYL